MRSKDIIKELLKMRNWSQNDLAVECGVSGPVVISGQLNRNTSMRVDNFVRMCNAMGFEVIVRDKMDTKKEFIVDDKTEPQKRNG